MSLTFATAVRLKNAGWPQHKEGQEMKPDQTYDGDNGWVVIPTLPALIHDCLQYRPDDDGSGFHWFVLEEQKDGRWAAGFDDFVPLDRIGQGATPDEACAELWMVLKHDDEEAKAKG